MQKVSIEGDIYQFPIEEMPPEVAGFVSDPFIVRPLCVDDYDRGFVESLSQLSSVDGISKETFEERFHYLRKHNEMYRVIVIFNNETKRVVGSGTVFIERKFLHNAGLAGHIEDIVVHDSCRGKNLGKSVIETLKAIAKQCKAYKIILDCVDHNVGFYDKCGFKRKGAQVKQ
ncbi:acyl-CoA N-acyltransferase [Cladochytrium replicatum]|nr:acyl-CoA N-acyltransferase [Cladochytrium replicatum]